MAPDAPKIVFVINDFPTVSETFILNQIKAAIDNNYKIKILACSKLETSSQSEIIHHYNLWEYISFAYAMPVSKFNRLFKAIKLSCKLRISFPILLKSLNPILFGKKALNLSILYQVFRISGHQDALLYHAQFGPNGVFLANMKKIGALNGEIITTFHGYDAHYTSNNFKELKNYYKNLFHTGELFTVNTPYLLEKVINLGCIQDELRILPMGVDTEFFSPPPIKPVNTIKKLVTVGRLISLKTINYGVEAVSKLLKQGINIHYTIVGEGPELENLKKQVKQLAIAEHVTFTGPLTQTEVLELLRLSDIYLMTSTFDCTGRRETQGIVTAEAQACGLPVVAFKSGGVPYTIVDGKTGYLAEEGDTEGFAARIAELLNNENKWKTFSENARKFVIENYSLEITSKELIKIYSGIL